jgi:hypothetical protein
MMTSIRPVLVLVLLASAARAGAQTRGPSDAMKLFVELEKTTPVATSHRRLDTTPYRMEHIDIPLDHPNVVKAGSFADWFYVKRPDLAGKSAIVVDVADYLPRHIRDFLYPVKAGKPHARWLFPKDDTKYRPALEAHLNRLGIPFEKGAALDARRTSSKSIIVTDPRTGRSYSFKGNNNNPPFSHGGGDRPYPARWGYMVRRLSDFYHKQASLKSPATGEPLLKHTAIAFEPAMTGFVTPGGTVTDQSQTVRLMEAVSQGKRHHISGFVYERGRSRPEVKDVNWDKALYGYGQALVEMPILLGFSVGSTHGQNIRFELDKDRRPTGRVVLLDLSDGHPIKQIWHANGQKALLRDWRKMILPGDNRGWNSIHDRRLVSQSFLGVSEPGHVDAVVRGMRDGLRRLTNLSEQEITSITSRRSLRPYGTAWTRSFQTSKQMLRAIKPECLGFMRRHAARRTRPAR